MFLHNILADEIQKYNCKYLLDIGSNDGDWAINQKQYSPDLYIYCIDGNEKNASFLINKSLPCQIVLLSDSQKEVKFYYNKHNETCTGMSYYKEKNDYYESNNYILKYTNTLNNILKKQDIVFDCIKIDTQGSEIDILKGANEYINNFKVICLETSLEEYNIGSPSQNDIIEYMNSIGYIISNICGESRYTNGQLFQQDLIFVQG